LSFLFWPDQPEDQAHNNLRQTLHRLRLVLPDHERFLEINSSTVRWRQDSPFYLDVADFEAALDIAGKAEAAGKSVMVRQNLEHAISLFQGELLPSCYDDWIIPNRERLHRLCIAALEKMVALLEQQQLYNQAVTYARHLLQIDPLYEPGYRLLMRLYALVEDRTSALRTYRACEEIFQRELTVEPETATREIYQRLLAAQPASKFSSFQEGSPQLPLLGREGEWSKLRSAWQQVANGRTQIVLISGEAGICKSRLAEEMLVWLKLQGIHFARTWAYTAEGRLSYGPLVDWLRSEVCSSQLKTMEKIWLIELSRLLPDLLIEIPQLPLPESLMEDAQRQGRRSRSCFASADCLLEYRLTLALHACMPW
jgi:DNA-binding SARP family transcriptional activator